MTDNVMDLHDKLTAILDSDDAKAIVAVGKSIEALYESLGAECLESAARQSVARRT